MFDIQYSMYLHEEMGLSSFSVICNFLKIVLIQSLQSDAFYAAIAWSFSCISLAKNIFSVF